MTNSGEPPSYSDTKMFSFKGKVVVANSNGPGKGSVWITDGTSDGTRELASIYPGTAPFIINESLVLDGEDSAVRLLDLNSGSVTQVVDGVADSYADISYLGGLADGRGLFIAGRVLYVSNGTAAGTNALFTFSQLARGQSGGFAAPSSSDPNPLRVFSIAVGENDTTVVTDGTEAGTVEVPLSAYQMASNESLRGVQFGNQVIYARASAEFGVELWRLSLENLQSSMIKDINPGSAGSLTYTTFRLVNNKVFFVADDGIHGDELWVTDGTSEGTLLTKDIAPGQLPGVSGLDGLNFPAHPAVGQYIVFNAQPEVKDGLSTSATQRLWASDGTPKGTFQLLKSDLAYSYPRAVLNNDGILVAPSREDFGVKLTDGKQGLSWDRGVFLRFFDPSAGLPTSAQLVAVAGSSQLLNSIERFNKVGAYYYLEIYDPSTRGSSVTTAPQQLCANADFKPTPGQCGCGVEELPADSSGTIVTSDADSDGSVVCLTPIGPIHVPAAFKGDISGTLLQSSGRPDSVRLILPASLTRALQGVVVAPQVGSASHSGARQVAAAAKMTIKPQHAVSIVVIDKSKKTLRRLPLRRTTSGKFTIKLGRRLTARHVLAFQYAVGVKDKEQYILQTPYKKRGVVKLSKSRR